MKNDFEKLKKKFRLFEVFDSKKKRLENFKNPSVTQKKPRFYFLNLAIVTFNDIKISFCKTARSLYLLEKRRKSKILKSRNCEIFLQIFLSVETTTTWALKRSTSQLSLLIICVS